MANMEEAHAMLDAFMEPGRNVSRTDLENLKALLGDDAPDSNHYQKRASAMRATAEGKAPGAADDNRTGQDDITKTSTLGNKNPPNPDENPGHGAGDGKDLDGDPDKQGDGSQQ